MEIDQAVAVRLEETQKELEATKAKLTAAQREVIGLVGRNNAQGKVIDELTAQKAALETEDVKQLRKRLQKKTERVAELERELMQLKSKPSGPVTPAVPGLSALLNAKLRRKLQQDGKTEPTAPPTPEAPASPAP